MFACAGQRDGFDPPGRRLTPAHPHVDRPPYRSSHGSPLFGTAVVAPLGDSCIILFGSAARLHPFFETTIFYLTPPFRGAMSREGSSLTVFLHRVTLGTWTTEAWW